MHFLLSIILILVYVKWAFSNYYILDSHPKYLGCSGEVSSISVTHITLCAMKCFKRNCKFFEYVDGVCHMKGDWSTLPRGTFHHLYKPRPNNLTNVAVGKSAEGSTYYQEPYTWDGISGKHHHGEWCAVDCYGGGKFHAVDGTDPWWRVDLGKVYVVHSINILPEADSIQDFRDITVYISTVYGNGAGDFSGFDVLTTYVGPYTTDQAWFNYTISPPKSIQYVAIQRQTSYGKMVLHEVEVIGEEDGPVAA